MGRCLPPPTFLAYTVALALLVMVPSPTEAISVEPPPPQPASTTAFSCDTVTEIPKAECQGLVAFYNSTNGTGWTYNAGWLQTNFPCSWYGVFCSQGSVQWSWLDHNQLRGTLPSELANLERLLLHVNSLGGAIPPELGNLTNLQEIFLHTNQLVGAIPPELGNLTNLYGLSLSRNLLSGPLPSTLADLTLESLFYDEPDLCEPGDAVFQTWLSGIDYLRRTDVVCGTQTVSGSVWDDQNRNGVQEVGEPPLPSLTVTLTANAGPLLSVAAGRQVGTDLNGAYRFQFISPGAYTIAVNGPGGYLPTVPGPVAVIVPAEGDLTVPPIGLAWASAHVYLPLIRR